MIAPEMRAMDRDEIAVRIIELYEREYELVRKLHPHFTEDQLRVKVEDNLAGDLGFVGKALRQALYDEADKAGGNRLLEAVRGADILDNSLPTPEAMLMLQQHAGVGALTNAFNLAASNRYAALQQERLSATRPGRWLSLRALFFRGKRHGR